VSAADVVRPTSGVAADVRAGEPSGAQLAASSDVIESVFASAIREGISPITERWVSSHQSDLMDALGPIIRRWMDEHLPKLVASVLIEELR
jgi:cell pole-organizing protein PopZ